MVPCPAASIAVFVYTCASRPVSQYIAVLVTLTIYRRCDKHCPDVCDVDPGAESIKSKSLSYFKINQPIEFLWLVELVRQTFYRLVDRIFHGQL
jgi:hypothetical protein